jgi:hypothetical protein
VLPAPKRVARRPAPPSVGYVNVFAEPWAHVYVGSRRVGTTPLRKLALPAGEHRLKLVNPAGPRAERTVRVVAGQTQLLDVELAR